MGTMAVTIKRALMVEMRTNDHRDDHLEYLATMPRIFYTKQSIGSEVRKTRDLLDRLKGGT